MKKKFGINSEVIVAIAEEHIKEIAEIPNKSMQRSCRMCISITTIWEIGTFFK